MELTILGPPVGYGVVLRKHFSLVIKPFYRGTSPSFGMSSGLFGDAGDLLMCLLAQVVRRLYSLLCFDCVELFVFEAVANK